MPLSFCRLLTEIAECMGALSFDCISNSKQDIMLAKEDVLNKSLRGLWSLERLSSILDIGVIEVLSRFEVRKREIWGFL